MRANYIKSEEIAVETGEKKTWNARDYYGCDIFN